jgi:hypothetical protein
VGWFVLTNASSTKPLIALAIAITLSRRLMLQALTIVSATDTLRSPTPSIDHK